MNMFNFFNEKAKTNPTTGDTALSIYAIHFNNS